MFRIKKNKVKPKVLLLGPYPPPMGGVVTYLCQIYHLISSDNCEWYGYGSKSIDDHNLHITQLKNFDPGLKLLKSGEKKVVLDSSGVFMEYLEPKLLWRWLAAIVLRRIRWIKVIHDVNLPDRHALYPDKEKRLIRFSSWFVWRYVVVNSTLSNWLAQELGSSRKISIIPSLISLSPCADKSDLPLEFNTLLAESDLVISSIGAMNADYGFDQVIKAVSNLNEILNCRISLVLLCTDFAEEINYSKCISESKIRVCILRNLPHSSVLGIFRHSNAVVRSVIKESYGLSRVEAILQGTPVVATNTGETRGMLVYNYGDIEALTSQLKTALTTDLQEENRYWATTYSKEAEDNKNKLFELISSARVSLC